MHKKIAFLELIGGVSGDMLIGALIDAGLSKKESDQIFKQNTENLLNL